MNALAKLLNALTPYLKWLEKNPQVLIPPKPSLKITLPKPMPPVDTFAEWNSPENVRHNIRVIGDEFNFNPHWKDLLCDIGRCESGFNPNARLVNSAKSIDRGLYQWNSWYHPEITDAIAYDPAQNTRLACKALIAKKATAYWSASKPCWNVGGKYDDII